MMQPLRQLVARALAPKGYEPTENGTLPKAPLLLPLWLQNPGPVGAGVWRD